MNIGDEYLGLGGEGGWRGLIGRAPRAKRRFWRDTHLRCEGPAVGQLQQVFFEDWYFATGAVPGGERHVRDLFPDPGSPGNAVAQTVANGPVGGTASGEQAYPRGLSNLFLTAITAAKRSVDLTTGYFVPPQAVAQALEAAALRGVRVRLLVPGTGGKPWTIFAGRSEYDSLLSAGVEIYEYRRGTLHAKTLAVDGTWSLVGSANLDARSFYLNFEVGLALYDDRTAHRLAERFDADLARATRIELETWSRRSGWRVLAENFCRMFAPVF